jgi:hypothetical protein
MLDFSQVVTQIESFSVERASGRERLLTALAEAARRLHTAAPVWEDVSPRLQGSKTSWLVADWKARPDAVISPSICPPEYTVFASDGSQIVSDRHDIALCYLLNVSRIVLNYGDNARAELSSSAVLSPPEEDAEAEALGELTAIAGKRLGVRRQLAEFAALAAMVSAPRPAGPALALFDGSLILWTLETEPDGFRSEALEQMHQHFDRLEQICVPLVGYISRPASRDVVNSLRVAHCPHTEANCDRQCPNRARPRPHFVAPDCAGTEGVRDADLFAEILCEGERSAVFGSESNILDSYRSQHRVCFFYLHVGTEIARCEIPQWVAEDIDLMNAVQTLCVDQARKGFGYPVALAEAHEQAIVRNAEKDAFFQLLERMFVTSGQSALQTQKSVSKRARRV